MDKTNLEFKDVGEIRFGPAYFEVKYKGIILSGDYGRFVKEFDNYVFLEKWLTTSASEGPRVKLTVINKQTDSVAYLRTVEGFIDNVSILSEKEFEYGKRYSSGMIPRFSVLFDDLKLENIRKEKEVKKDVPIKKFFKNIFKI